MRITTWGPLLVLVLVEAMPCVASARGSSAQNRLRPPAFVTCDRNQLTAFSGKVVALARETGSTTLQMETDENTRERFTLRHPGGDASAWFFLGGRAFTQADWATLLPSGQLRSGARATVWVCGDQANPKVDWAPAVSAP